MWTSTLSILSTHRAAVSLLLIFLFDSSITILFNRNSITCHQCQRETPTNQVISHYQSSHPYYSLIRLCLIVLSRKNCTRYPLYVHIVNGLIHSKTIRYHFNISFRSLHLCFFLSQAHLDQAHSRVQCTYCNEQFTSVDLLNQHQASQCRKITVHCPLREFGCQETVRSPFVV